MDTNTGTPGCNTYCTGTFMTSHSKSIGINMEMNNSFHSSEKTLDKILECVCGNMCPFIQKSICDLSLAEQSLIQFILKVFDGLEVRALSGPVKFFHINSANYVIMDLALCYRAQSCWNRTWKQMWKHCVNRVLVKQKVNSVLVIFTHCASFWSLTLCHLTSCGFCCS